MIDYRMFLALEVHQNVVVAHLSFLFLIEKLVTGLCIYEMHAHQSLCWVILQNFTKLASSKSIGSYVMDVEGHFQRKHAFTFTKHSIRDCID